MKRGWLIYDPVGAEKNGWFIRRLQTEISARGGELQLRIFSDKEGFFSAKTPDFAIVRTICPSLNERLERVGARVFNNGKTARLANDKALTFSDCRRWGIPVLETVRLEEAGEDFPFPCVMKSVDGHGGAEVFWVETRAQAAEKARAGKRYVLQRPNEILGKDMRLYAIGGEIVAGVLRESERDFRSNFSLGGRVSLARADEAQKAIVKNLYRELAFDYVGIDFLPTKSGGWVLNEIEDSAGARMLYQCGGVDIIAMFAEHIMKNI